MGRNEKLIWPFVFIRVMYSTTSQNMSTEHEWTQLFMNDRMIDYNNNVFYYETYLEINFIKYDGNYKLVRRINAVKDAYI